MKYAFHNRQALAAELDAAFVADRHDTALFAAANRFIISELAKEPAAIRKALSDDLRALAMKNSALTSVHLWRDAGDIVARHAPRRADAFREIGIYLAVFDLDEP